MKDSDDFPDGCWFLTLTMHENLDMSDTQRCWGILSDAWDKLLKRIRRHLPYSPQYIQIPEISPEEKRLHAHLLINAGFAARPYPRIPKAVWLSPFLHDNPREVGLGYEYAIEPVQTAGMAAWYVSKYIGKAMGVKFPKGARRVRTSRNFPYPPGNGKLPGWDYEVLQCSERGRKSLVRHVLTNHEIVDKERGGYVTWNHPLIARDIT